VNGLKGAHNPGCPFVRDSVRTGETMAAWDSRQAREHAAHPLPDDFDENTPPPRARPQGEPLPRHVVLPPGESPEAEFLRWDRSGRIPPGCVLAEFVGTLGGGSGYRVAMNPPGLAPFGGVGSGVPAGARFRQVAAVALAHRPMKWFCVLCPTPTE
jgi:hypothetical protein